MKKAEEGIKVYEHFFKTRYINKGMDYRYVIQETTKQIDDIAKESEAKLKKDLAGKVAIFLEGAKEDLKKLEKTKKEFKKGNNRK